MPPGTRASKFRSTPPIDKAGVTGQEDTVNASLSFVNIHYFAAAATLFGSEVHGGYEFEDFAYDGKFRHVEGYDSCANCHDPHTLEIKVGECAGCHTNVQGVEDLKNIRMNGSKVDYDGDGNITEGIYYEIQGMEEHAAPGHHGLRQPGLRNAHRLQPS